MAEIIAAPVIHVAELDARIHFDTELQIMEADFSDFHFTDSRVVNAFYDRLETRIAATGEDQWFFLVNLNGTRIDTLAWTAYSRRGRALNKAHSMGSVRFDASEETRQQIIRAANTEAFNPNLFTDREAALARIAEMPSKRRARIVHIPNYTIADFAYRIAFDRNRAVLDIDFSDFVFHHSRDVDDFFDFLETCIDGTDRRWFLLFDLNGCEILPAAWVRYTLRSKQIRTAALGAVRFAHGSDTMTDDGMVENGRAANRPNIRNTRQEAEHLIDKMRATWVQTSH